MASDARAQSKDESCITCHLALGIESLTQPVEDYKADIHAAKGFGRVACHGGDPSSLGPDAKDRKKGYIGKPGGLQIVEVCGKCHADANFMRRYNPSLRGEQIVVSKRG